MDAWLAAILLGVVFSVAGWLLSNKDKKQETEINQLREDLKTEISKRETAEGELYRLHNLDAQALLKLELDITRAQHADPRFTSLEKTFKDGFHDLGISIKEMMQDHVNTHHQGGKQ